MNVTESNYNPHPITKCIKPPYVKERKARNPLRCEKTPRTFYQQEENWNYSPPPGEEFPEKWNYNSRDRPLMENFASLRKCVADDEARMQAHLDRIKAFQDTQASLAAQPYQVTVRDSARSSARNSARSTGRSSRPDESARLDDSAEFPVTNTGRSTDRGFDTTGATGRSEDLTKYPASSLKSMQHEHPEILAKMRAQRAAKYVTSLRNPLEPPPYNSISSRQGFFPAGTNNLHPPPKEHTKKGTKTKRKSDSQSSGKIVVTSRELDTTRMKESLDSLVDELAKTDAQIARQELKIALAPKVKTFDKKGTKK